MRRILFFGLMMFVGLKAYGADKEPIVVELFTSEGCSSCPPADAVLTKLAKEKGTEIIPLAFHVDYWDRLGWKDTFSSAEYTRRQEGYAQSFRSDQIYTPQMIVDGTTQFLGSDAAKARTSIAAATLKVKGHVDMTLGDIKGKKGSIGVTAKVSALPPEHGEAEMILCITEDDLSSDVRRGENAGSILRHTGVVRAWQPMGIVASKNQSSEKNAEVKIDPSWKRENLHVVVLVQEKEGRRFLGVGTQRVGLK